MPSDHRQDGEQPLTCSNCDAALQLPDNLDADSTTCPYCGAQTLLPSHVVAHRKERARRQREAAAAAAREAEAARRKRAAKKRSVIVGIVVTLAILATGGGIALLAYANRDVRPRDPLSTGQDQVAQWLASLKSRGCDHMVAPPEMIAGNSNWTMNMKRRGNCLTVMAATGVAHNVLTLTMRTPFGQPVPAATHGSFVHLTHCADSDGAYPVAVIPTTDHFYTFAAIDCPRELYETPRTDDPNYTGQAYVAARMKALYAAGCTHVVHPAEVIETGIKWTPKLAESKTANCLHLLAATGAPRNTLTLTMQTPFGEPVQVPPPGNAIDFLYCGESGGPHPITVVPAANDYYTFAAVDCPRGKR